MIEVSFWSKSKPCEGSDPFPGWEIYIVPRHGAFKPLDDAGWVPVTTYHSSFEDFIEECAIQGHSFVMPRDIEKITGQKWQPKFNMNYRKGEGEPWLTKQTRGGDK